MYSPVLPIVDPVVPVPALEPRPPLFLVREAAAEYGAPSAAEPVDDEACGADVADPFGAP